MAKDTTTKKTKKTTKKNTTKKTRAKKATPPVEETTATQEATQTAVQKQYIGNIDMNAVQVREALTGYLMSTSEDVRALAERTDIQVECNFAWNVGTDGLRASFFGWPATEAPTEADAEVEVE